MTEPAAARQLTTALAFAYPILAHVAIARGSIALMIAAVALLAVVMLLPALARGSIAAWLMLPIVFAGCWWHCRDPRRPRCRCMSRRCWYPRSWRGYSVIRCAPDERRLIEQLIRLVHAAGAIRRRIRLSGPMHAG